MQLSFNQHSSSAQQWLILLGHLFSVSHLVPGSWLRMHNLQFKLLASRLEQENIEPILPHSGDLSDTGQPSVDHGQFTIGLVFRDNDSKGAYILEKEVSRGLSHHEKRTHINVKLRAIYLRLQSFEEFLRGKQWQSCQTILQWCSSARTVGQGHGHSTTKPGRP